MSPWDLLWVMPVSFVIGGAVNSLFIRLTQGVWPWTSVDKRIARLKRRGEWP